MNRWMLVGVGLLLSVSGWTMQPEIVSFTPQGEVRQIKQVSVRFSVQMVPFGDLRGKGAPFHVECPNKGKGRWLDGKHWVFDFDETLSAGTRCRFGLRREVKALDGQAVAGKTFFIFNTGGPKVIQSRPYEGSGIVEDQVLILKTDGKPTSTSILKNAYFLAEGTSDQIPVQLITGQQREDILETQYQYKKAKRKEDPKLDAQLVLLQPTRNFPVNTKIQLIWGAAIASASGMVSTQDQVLKFRSRKEYSVRFSCIRENADSKCNPLGALTVRFTSETRWAMAKKVQMKDASGKVMQPKVPEKRKDEDLVWELSYHGPLAAESSFTIEVPKDLRDDAGRLAINGDRFPMTVETGGFPPLAKFAAKFGILEWKDSPVLPLTLRNLEKDVKSNMYRLPSYGKLSGKFLKLDSADVVKIQDWIGKVEQAVRSKSVLQGVSPAPKSIDIPKELGPEKFEVIGIPFKEPGLYVVELKSEILAKSLFADTELKNSKVMYVPTMALITNMSVHLKWGRESSLVWVTALDTGKPVVNAQVRVFNCDGTELWKGRTDGEGRALVSGIPRKRELKDCEVKGRYYNYRNRGLFVTAAKGKDMAFVQSGWNKGIERWRFQLMSERSTDPLLAHTILGRSLLRAGETIHMKHLARKKTTRGFDYEKDLPSKVQIQHLGSAQKYEFPLKWDSEMGVAFTDWEIPRSAKLGVYTIYFRRKTGKKEWQSIRSGSFAVQEFRIPLMTASIIATGKQFIATESMELHLGLRYLSGGGAGGAPVQLRHIVSSGYGKTFSEFKNFTFANGSVKVGKRPRQQSKNKLFRQDLKLDDQGGINTTIGDLKPLDQIQNLKVELEYRDPNGEVKTKSSSFKLWPSKHLVGLKLGSYSMMNDQVKFQAAVADVNGKPVGGTKVSVHMLERKHYSHRKRLVGGFYAYETHNEMVDKGEVCTGTTNSKGKIECALKTDITGNVEFVATTTGPDGHASAVHRSTWLMGEKSFWFGAKDHDRIDLIPDRTQYEPGETAKFQVRMPFREATALITVEREGIMHSFVKELSGKVPVVKLKIRKTWGPNIFVSALVVRGRVSGIKPTALVDLGRPAYKMGYAKLDIGWKPFQLKVDVKTDRSVYKVRHEMKVKIKVRSPDGVILKSKGEVAIAVVDEGLLELAKNTSWNVVEAMMARRGNSIETSSAQMHVVGKRHFGLKALPSGGGGGQSTTRELFDTLIAWKGRVRLNKRGEATVTIPLNDSLSSFRVVALAQIGRRRFGHGETSVRSTQDIMLMSGIAPLVRNGDAAQAGFTVRNTTKRQVRLSVSLKIPGSKMKIRTRKVRLKPSGAKEFSWSIKIPKDVTELTYQLTAKQGKRVMDSLKVKQKVTTPVPVRTFQATLRQLTPGWSFEAAAPKGALPNQGGLRVRLQSTILTGIGPTIDYMKWYPYSCLEQKISKAVVIGDRKAWDKIMQDLPGYVAKKTGLVSYFPGGDYGSPILTAYLLEMSRLQDWPLPAKVLSSMLSGLVKYVEGKLPIFRSEFVTADRELRKILVMAALAPRGQLKPTMIDGITIEPNLWPNSTLMHWFTVMNNLKSLKDQSTMLKQVETIIQSRVQTEGTLMKFSTKARDYMWWLMGSHDVDSAQLILTFIDQASWQQFEPLFMRGLLARQQKGRWTTTVGNAWSVVALRKFAAKFEKEKITGKTSMEWSDEKKVQSWAKRPKGSLEDFNWKGEDTKKLVLKHKGTGKPWALVQSRAAIPLKEGIQSGFVLQKEWKPIEQKESGKWSRGDIIEVRISVEGKTDMTWVVVDDPIPAGATILGSVGQSSLADRGRKGPKGAYPRFVERSFAAYRAYYQYVPTGEWSFSYRIRLNNVGTFQLPPTRVEAMYYPEMFAMIPNETVQVE